MFVYGAFGDRGDMTVDADSVENENDIYKILNSLKIDFDIDFMYMSKDYNEARETIKIATLNFLKRKT